MQDVNYQLFAESVLSECTLGLKRSEADPERTEEILDMVGLSEYKERHPNTLSGGQKQRLSVAISLVYDKDLILFDEPTSGLDKDNMEKIAGVIDTLRSMGKYVLIVSHDNEFMNRCCDCVYEMS